MEGVEQLVIPARAVESQVSVDLHHRSQRREGNLSIGRAIQFEKEQDVMCVFIVESGELIVDHSNTLEHGLTFGDERLPIALLRLIDINRYDLPARPIKIGEEVKYCAIVSHQLV